MTQVRVARYTVFDFTRETPLAPPRYARLDTISIIGGRPIRGTEILVDEQDLDEFGMTQAGYSPDKDDPEEPQARRQTRIGSA